MFRAVFKEPPDQKIIIPQLLLLQVLNYYLVLNTNCENQLQKELIQRITDVIITYFVVFLLTKTNYI